MKRDKMIRVLAEMCVKGKRENAKDEHVAVKQFLEGLCLGDDAEYLDYDVDKMEQHIINFTRALQFVIQTHLDANSQNVMSG
jgi:hypothetical protein